MKRRTDGLEGETGRWVGGRKNREGRNEGVKVR